MNVTELVPACFDLHEGSLNIIIHNLCFVCMGMLCVSVCWTVLCCMLLRALVRSKTEALCQFTSPPPLAWRGVWGPSHLPAPHPLWNLSFRHLQCPNRPGSHQQGM